MENDYTFKVRKNMNVAPKEDLKKTFVDWKKEKKDCFKRCPPSLHSETHLQKPSRIKNAFLSCSIPPTLPDCSLQLILHLTHILTGDNQPSPPVETVTLVQHELFRRHLLNFSLENLFCLQSYFPLALSITEH